MPLKMEQTRSQSSGRLKTKDKNLETKKYNKKSTSFFISNLDETKNNISNDSGI
jgi:hypothetical protein